MFDRCVAIGGKVLDQTLVGEKAGLGQAVHAFSYFEVDETIVGQGAEVVLVDNFLRDLVEREAHVFVPVKGCFEVDFFDIGGHEACPGGQNSAIEAVSTVA